MSPPTRVERDGGAVVLAPLRELADRRFSRAGELVARATPSHSDTGDERPLFKTYVRHGDARTVIKAAVKKLDTDLLLLGTHGYTAAAQLFLGTVAGDVLRDVRCDVLVVPPRPRSGRR